MNKILFSLLASLLFLSSSIPNAAAHCEIPCGIYDDQLRTQLIAEHATTIEKAMKQIVELSAADEPNHNQIARWVANKESHASEIQHIVSQYFMTQRIKPGMEGYGEKLELLHRMLVAAMKCKQTTDLDQVSELRSLTKKFTDLYLKK